MASIWKHPKTPNLSARYRGANGKTVNRSTGVQDPDEALSRVLPFGRVLVAA